jgi:hypothetical protein
VPGEDERHRQEHPREPDAADVRDLPQASRNAAVGGLEHRDPDQQRRGHEELVLERVQERVAKRRVVEHREVPEVEAEDPDRPSHQRLRDGSEHAANGPRASQRPHHGERQQERVHRPPRAQDQQRRRQVAQQQVLRHVCGQQVRLPEVVEGREQRYRQQRKAAEPHRLL